MNAPSATPDDGRPSDEARARLAADLHEQLASSRLAWDAALLRSDAALATGDEDEVRAALDDHERLLGALQERLGAVVAAASVGREAERIVRASAADLADAHGSPDGGATAVGAPRASGGADVGDVKPQRLRRGASSLVGAAAAVLLVAGLFGGDLLLETDGTIARTTSADPATEDVRARIAAEHVAGRDGAAGGADVSGPTAELPAFSGSLPPTPRPAADEDPATPSTATDGDLDAPESETLAGSGEERPTFDPDPLGVPTDGPAPEDELGLRDLVDRLRDLDGGSDVDSGASLPRTLAELVEVLEDRPTMGPGSDPAAGLR